jgi:exodeoxyribonuclease V alpha subunit
VAREESIEGAVERIVYSNEENAWTVLRLFVRGKGELTAVGNLLGVQPGESLRLTGRWVKDRKYGRQFQVESYLTVKPATFVGIEKYLGSGLIRGIGQTMARRLVQRFGLETLEVIDRQPQRLAEVEGIGPKRTERILEAWEEQRGIKDVMVFLQSHGVRTSHAVKIYKRYGADAVGQVRSDPYQLARDVYGIGFRTADRIGRHLDIAADSPQRARAGVLHALGEATAAGHTYLPRAELAAESAELLEVDAAVVEAAIDELVAGEDLAAVTPAASHLETAIYPKALEVAERGVAEILRSLTAQQSLPVKIDVDRAVAWYEKECSIELG